MPGIGPIPVLNAGYLQFGLSFFTIHDMRPEGDWIFIVPELKPVLDVQLGERRELLELEADTLCAFPSFNRFFVLARAAFVYQFVPRRKRIAVLRWAEPGKIVEAAPPSLAEREAGGDTSLLRPEATDSPIPFELLRELYPLRKVVEQLPVILSG